MKNGEAVVRHGLAIEHEAVAIEPPGQLGVFGKPARVGQRYEIETELGVRRVGFPEAAAAPKVGQAAVDAHTSPCPDQDRFRGQDHTARPVENIFASFLGFHWLSEISSIFCGVFSHNVLRISFILSTAVHERKLDDRYRQVCSVLG